MNERASTIELLRHAHDYIWADKSRPLLERLAACNLLFDCALALLNENPSLPRVEFFAGYRNR